MQHYWTTFFQANSLAPNFEPTCTEWICWVEIDGKLMRNLCIDIKEKKNTLNLVTLILSP